MSSANSATHSDRETGRDRVLAALTGQAAGLAAGVAYPEIPFRDRCEEHMSEPWWLLDDADPERCLPATRHYLEMIGCDWWPVLWTQPRAERDVCRYLREDKRDFRLDTCTGQRTEIFHPSRPLPRYAVPPELPPPPPVPSDEECLAKIKIIPAEQQLESGMWELAAAHHRELGREFFLYSYTSTPFGLSFAKGFSEVMVQLSVEPDFFHRMADRILLQQREYFRAMTAVGLDGVWLQDMYAGAELLSPQQYQEIVLRHGRDLVQAAHECGLKVIHYYMGAAADRLDSIAAMGADVLLFEEGRKGYKANLPMLAVGLPQPGPVLMGNLAAEGVLAQGSETSLKTAVGELVRFGRSRNRFLFGTGSPPTPETSLARIRDTLKLARDFWKK